MNVINLLVSVQQEAERRAYISREEILDLTASLLKARLYISPTLYIQIYRNDQFATTNFVLIYNQQRIYARDELGGQWHRHPAHDPDFHDTSPEGKRAVSLQDLLDEIEAILAQRGLP